MSMMSNTTEDPTEMKDPSSFVGNDEIESGEELDDNDIDPNDLGDIFGNIDEFSDNVDPKKNPLLWVQTQISRNVNPRVILQDLVPHIAIPESVNDLSVWRLIFEIITEPSPRQRLPHVSTLGNVIHLIKESKNILVLTGAGVSVSCGIPDFRSRNGIYARLHEEYPDLPDPQAMFDIHYFRCNPCPFFRFAKAIYPGRFTPSVAHYFIQHIEKTGRLLRNYTQNIDTLEQVAGINNVVTCHGSFSNATCMNCKLKVKASEIEEEVFSQKIPYCKQCNPTDGVLNILKPDIVFFGEGLPEEFHRTIEKDKEKADLLIVIGSSLKVRPVALIPSFLKPEIPQILINRERLPHMQFDVELYGNCDDIIVELCRQLGDDWTHFTKSFSSSPVDHGKYKSLIETNNSPSHHLNDLCSSSEKADVVSEIDSDNNVTLKENRFYGMPGNMGPSHNIEDVQGSSSCYTSEDASMKRSMIDESGSSDCKKSRLESDKKSGTENSVFYLFYPPNRYIFHGAELECPGESDNESSDNEHDCSEDCSDHNCSGIEECKENSVSLLEIPIGRQDHIDKPSYVSNVATFSHSSDEKNVTSNSAELRTGSLLGPSKTVSKSNALGVSTNT